MSELAHKLAFSYSGIRQQNKARNEQHVPHPRKLSIDSTALLKTLTQN